MEGKWELFNSTVGGRIDVKTLLLECVCVRVCVCARPCAFKYLHNSFIE